MYQFEPEVWIIKKDTPGETTGFRTSCSYFKSFVNSTGKHLFESCFNKDLQLYSEETSSIQVFSCETYKISKKTFFYRTTTVAVSEV